MKVLLTGGAGSVGSTATAELIQAGHAVVVFDNLSQGHRGAVHPNATFVQGDLVNIGEVERVFAEHKPEAGMHFAARSLVGESMQKPFRYLGENITNALRKVMLPRRWVVERTFGCFMSHCRLVHDYVTSSASGRAFTSIVMIRIQPHRQA